MPPMAPMPAMAYVSAYVFIYLSTYLTISQRRKPWGHRGHGRHGANILKVSIDEFLDLGIPKILKIRISEFLNFWISVFLYFCISVFLNFWISEFLYFWISVFLNFCISAPVQVATVPDCALFTLMFIRIWWYLTRIFVKKYHICSSMIETVSLDPNNYVMLILKAGITLHH